MITHLLGNPEGKTLEFKENCRPLHHIVRTVVAFANTAGGVLAIGIRDKTREVMGVEDPLADEERLANTFADSIRPLLIPDIQIHHVQKRSVLIVNVPHSIGPYAVRSEGVHRGVYVRLGSTNRRAGPEMIAEIQRLARNAFFDEQPCPEISSEDIDFRAASELFQAVSRPFTPAKQKSLGLMIKQGNREIPSQGAFLLFGKNRSRLFPDAAIRCARFAGLNSEKFMDQIEIDEHLPIAIESVIRFIERNTRQGIRIGRVKRREVPEYPVEAVREAVINAVVHGDYSLGGTGLKISIFDDRIEVTNPGILPFGLTLESALSGVSRLRNRVIGRVFRELKLIEQWGTGIGRMISVCQDAGLRSPKFEEVGHNFRVTLYGIPIAPARIPVWQKRLLLFLEKRREITTQEAARLWKTSDRSARSRLRKLVNGGTLAEVGTSPNDPKRKYILRKG